MTGGGNEGRRACTTWGPTIRWVRGQHEIGAVIHAPRLPGGGGSDGHRWYVTACGQYPVDHEDDEPGWQYWALVRPATDAECAR